MYRIMVRVWDMDSVRITVWGIQRLTVRVRNRVIQVRTGLHCNILSCSNVA